MAATTRQSLSNPYLITLATGAKRATEGQQRAREDAARLVHGLTENLRKAAIRSRLQELENRVVTIEVRVRNTLLHGQSTWYASKVSDDTVHMLCRKDYYDDENCLFNLLVERLPLDEWGSATAGCLQEGLHYPNDFTLYGHALRQRSASEDTKVVRERCREVLRHEMLQIKSWDELLENGPEDLNAPWFNQRWCITLWRVIKLSN